ncbi:hypothetical protein ACHWQZ_G004633 [Mnemiopsis leidyi]
MIDSRKLSSLQVKSRTVNPTMILYVPAGFSVSLSGPVTDMSVFWFLFAGGQVRRYIGGGTDSSLQITSFSEQDVGIYYGVTQDSNYQYVLDLRICGRSETDEVFFFVPGRETRLTVRQNISVSRVIWYYVVDGQLHLLPDRTGTDISVTQAGSYVAVVILTDGSSVSQTFHILDVDLSKSYDVVGLIGWSLRLYNPHQGSNPDNVWYKVTSDGSPYLVVVSDGVRPTSTDLIFSQLSQSHDGYYLVFDRGQSPISALIWKLTGRSINEEGGSSVVVYSTSLVFRLTSSSSCTDIRWFYVRQGILSRIQPDQYIDISVLSQESWHVYGNRITMVMEHVVGMWYRVSGNQVSALSGSGGKYQVTSNSLSLRDFQPSDQGVYVAQLPGRGLFFWRVHGFKLPTEQISLYGFEGLSLTLSAQDVVTWWRIVDNRATRITQSDKDTSVHVGGLTLNRLGGYLAGLYYAEGRSRNYLFHVTVHSFTTGTNFVYYVPIGAKLVIVVESLSQESSEVVWYEGEDKRQLNEAGVIVSMNGKSLTISSMQEHLYGSYSAVVTTDQNTAYFIYELRRLSSQIRQEILYAMEGSTVSLFTDLSPVSILHTRNDGYTFVITDKNSAYRLFDTKLIIVSLDSATEGTYYLSDNGGNTIVYKVYSLSHQSTTYRTTITVFNGWDITLSTEKYNQGVTWYKITAGLLLPIQSSDRIFVQPSVLLIRNSLASDQGMYMGKSASGDWFMFTVSVIKEVDPIKYWVMPGDTFMLFLRKQYLEINWYFMSTTYMLISNSATYTVINNGQQLVIKNINSNLAGFYQVSYLSGRSTIDVFYELRIGNVIRRTQLYALDGQEIMVTGTSRNPTGWCFKRGQEPTSPLRRADVELVTTGLVIRTLSVETAGTYIYAHENGDMEVVEIVRVVLPSLVNTVNVWLGQQVSLPVRSNQIISTWYKVSDGILTPLDTSIQLDSQSLLIVRAELDHQGLYLARTESNVWLAWRVTVNREPPSYTTVTVPEGVSVRLDVAGLVLNWFRFPSSTPLQPDIRIQIGNKHLVLRNVDSSLIGYYKAEYRNSQGGGVTIHFKIELARKVTSERIRAVEGRSVYLTTSLSGITAWYHVGQDGLYTVIQQSSHYHTISTVDIYSAGRYYITNAEGEVHMIEVQMVSISTIYQVAYLKGARESLGTGEVVTQWYIQRDGALQTFTSSSELVSVTSTNIVFQSISQDHQGVYVAELYSGNIVGWDVRVTDAPEQSSTLYVPIGLKFGLEVVTRDRASWYFLESSSTTPLTSTVDFIVYNTALIIKSFSHQTKGYYKATTTVESKSVDFYFNLLPAVSVVREEIVALAGSDVKLGDGNIQNGVWYSDRRSDYVRHLAGAGDWFDISGDYFLIRSINYDLQGEYYVSDAAGNMVQYKVKVLDISGTNTVTLTALLGSDVILTPKGGVFQLQWYVGKEGILTKPSTYLEYNSQQLSIKNVQFHHEAVYYGFDGTNWFLWKLQVREQPPDYTTYYVPQGANFALSVPDPGQWFSFSSPSGGPITSGQDLVVKEGGRMFIVINFRDELAGYYKFVASDQQESYIRLETILSMVTTVDVFCVPDSTVTLQPQISGISLWIKTLSDQLTTVVQVNDNKFDITNGILTIRQFEIRMEGVYIAVDPSGYGYKYTLKIVPEPIQKITLAAILGSSLTLSSTSDLYGNLQWFKMEGGVLVELSRHIAVYATSIMIQSVSQQDSGVYFARDQSNRWVQWTLDVIKIDRYDTIYLESGTKFRLTLDLPASWTFLTSHNTIILQTSQDYLLSDSGRTLLIRNFQREQEGFYRATTDSNSHFMFYVRLVQGVVEEEVVLYAFFGSRVELVPRESALLPRWYRQDEEGVVFPVTKSGPQLQSEGNSLVILEVSTFTEGMYYVSNDNGYYKKFRLVGVGVPSEQTVEVINVMTGSEALLLPKSVINVERKWYRILDGQFTLLTNDQTTEPKFDRLTIISVREEDKGYYATNIGEYWQFYQLNILPFEVEVRYYVKEGKNFGIKLPVNAARVQWKFYTTSSGPAKNQILDSVSDKLIIYNFRADNEGFYQAVLQDSSNRVYLYKILLERIPGSRFEMYVLKDTRVTMTTRLDPPVHWYLTSVAENVVYARSADLTVYGNQAVISKVTSENWGTYYVSDERGELDEFEVVLVSLVRTELVTRVRRTSVTLSTGASTAVVWYKSSDGMLERIVNSVRVYQSNQNIIIDSIQTMDEGLYIAHDTLKKVWFGWEVRVISSPVDSIPILCLPGYKLILSTTVSSTIWMYEKEGASQQLQHVTGSDGGSSVQISTFTKKNEGRYNVYFKNDPLESYNLQLVYMLDVQNVEYVLPGTSVEIGTRSDVKTKWIFIDQSVARFASSIAGVTEHSTSLLIEDFQTPHEGVYHFAVKNKEGVINHTVYKLVALQNVPVPTPVVMLLGYEFHLRVVFSQQPDQIHWYRVDAGVTVRILPSSKFQLRENGLLLVVSDVTSRDSGRYVAVGVFSTGQTQTEIYTCTTHDMVTMVTEIERPVGQDVVLVAPNSRSWGRVSGQSVVVLGNSDKYSLTGNALTIQDLQEEDAGVYIANFPTNSRLVIEGWKIIPKEPVNSYITMYVPAGRPISVPSPFDKSPVQWYRLTPNKQSIGSSLSITFSSPNVGEIVSYIVESQVARTDFTFHFIGVPALEEKQRTVYAVFGFPLKVQLSNSIQQVYSFSKGVLFVVSEDMWSADNIDIPFFVKSRQGTYSVIHQVGTEYFYQDIQVIGIKTPLVQQTLTGVFTFDLTLPATEKRVWLRYTQPPVFPLLGERYQITEEGCTIGSFSPPDVGIYVSISETFQYTWSVKGIHLPTIEQFYRKIGDDVLFSLPKGSQYTELKWYKVTRGLLYPLSLTSPFSQTSSHTVKITSVSREQEGIYVAIVKFSAEQSAIYAFQIFVEEIVSEYEYRMQVIEDQRVELILPLTDLEKKMKYTTTWFRVSSSNIRTELSASSNTTLLLDSSLLFPRIALGDSGTYQADVEFPDRTSRHSFSVVVNKLPAPFRVLESYVNYNVIIGFEGMPDNYQSVTWHYKKNSDRGIFIQLSGSSSKIVLNGSTVELNSVQLSDQGYYIAQLLYPDNVRYFVTYLQVNFLPGGDAIVIGYEGQNLTLSVNNQEDALFFTWTYFNSTTGTQLVDGDRLRISSRSLFFSRLMESDEGYYRINIYFNGGRKDESFIFQLIVLGDGEVTQPCPGTMRFYEKDCAPCQETCSNDKCLFECRSGVCACPAESPVYFQGRCIPREQCPKNHEYPCSQFGVEGYVYYGSDKCAPCPASCDDSILTSPHSCTCRKNMCGCPADKPVEYKGRCINRDDCPSQQCGGDSNMIFYESECALCNKTCSEFDSACSATCLTNVCGCPSHKPYLNPDGWCVPYDYCVDTKPVVCPNNQVFYEQCAPAQRSCHDDQVSVLGMISVGCKNKVCACPENKPFFVEGICRPFCPGISGPDGGDKTVVVNIVYELVGEALTLGLPDSNSIRRTRWFLDDAKLSSNSKYVVKDSFLTIKVLGEDDEGVYFANITTNTNDEMSYVFRVFPLQKSNYYVWFEQNPLTISTHLDLNQPLVWLKNIDNTLVNIEDKLMYFQKNYGDLTFVNLQPSDAGHYHAVYLDPETRKITTLVFNLAVIKQPQLQTRTCKSREDCSISVDLYPGWKQVDWYTVYRGVKEYLTIDNSKYRLINGHLTIARVLVGDERIYYGQVTYHSSDSYLITYPWKVDVIRNNLQICNGKSICNGEEGSNVELTIPSVINTGDVITWYYTIRGVRYPMTYVNGRFYIKQGGIFIEISNLKLGDSGQYYAVVTYANGTVVTTNYEITVNSSGEDTTYIDVGFDSCWEKSGDDCMKDSRCAWCADTDWTDYRCITSYSRRIQTCVKVVNPRPTVQITDGTSLGGNSTVQISPQRILVTMRPGQCAEVDTFARSNKNQPLDVMILQHQVPSVNRGLFNFMVKDLVLTLSSLANTTNFGYGTFSDRNTMPYAEEHQNYTDNPCMADGSCSDAHSFRALNYLEDNDQIYNLILSTAYSNNTISQGNSAFDALYQTLICQDIGWRESSNKMVIVALYNNPHVAGDGKLGGFVQPFDEVCRTGSTRRYGFTTDYPSVVQVANRLLRNNTIPVFVVSRSVDKKMLREMIPNSKVYDMTAGSRLDEELSNYYKSLLANPTVTQVDIPPGVNVSYICHVTGDPMKSCDNVAMTTDITFKMKICANKCLKEKEEALLNFPAYGQLRIDVKTECTLNLPSEPDSSKCNKRGTYQGGFCSCYSGWVGDKCDCNQGNGGNITQCINPRVRTKNRAPICSNRGTCQCGRCKCEDLTYGDYCECDHNNCPKGRVEGKNTIAICSDRGTCMCEKCMCSGGYSGEACQYNEATCKDTSGMLCGGRGSCQYGRCVCEDGYKGKHCQTCTVCTSCEDFQTCAECIFSRGFSKCTPECLGTTVIEKSSLDDIPAGTRECTVVVDDCLYFFYHKSSSFFYLDNVSQECVEVGAAAGGGGTEGVSEEDAESGTAILLLVGIILGILFLGILLLIFCKICCCRTGSCLLTACPCLGELIRKCGGVCSGYCSCCKSSQDKYEELTTGNDIPDVVDNPIYEPKKKETNPDGENSAAAPLEVDGVDLASNTYEAPLEDKKDKESEKPADSGKIAPLAPTGPGSDVNPHSLADIDSILQDTSPDGDPASGNIASQKGGDSAMSYGVITPPKREAPEVTESVENIVGPGEEEPVKKGPTKKGPTKDSLRPRDWGGADGGRSQYSYDPDDDNFDVDFDQSSITDTAASKQFSWMKSLTPINSLSGIDSNGHHDHKIKSFESLTDTTTETINTKKVRRQSRMVTIPNSVLIGLDQIPDQKAAIEYDPTVLKNRRLSTTTTQDITANIRNTRPYPDIVVEDVETLNVERHINITTNTIDVEKALKEEQKKLKKLQKEIEKEKKALEKSKKRQKEKDEDSDEQGRLNALLAAVTDNRNVKRISVVHRDSKFPAKISEETENSTESSDTISAKKLVTILAKNNILLDDDDKLELMESITLKGMGGDDALIEEMITAKAAQLKRVEEGEEEAIMDLIRSKVVAAGVALPDDIEGRMLVGLKNKITIGQEAGVSAASRSRFVSEVLEKLREEIAGQGGLVISASQITSLIARVSGKLSVKLSAQQNQELIEATEVKAAQAGMTEGMLEQWVTKILLKYKISNKINLDAEISSLRAALEQKIGASLGISLDGDMSEKVSVEQIQAILGKRKISLSTDDIAELVESVTVRGMAGDSDLVEEMIASRALQLKAVTGGDEEATRELIRSKLQMSGLAIPGDMEDGFVAGLQDKMASQKVDMGAASRSKFVAEMLAKLKSDISKDGGLILSEEDMLAIISRVSSKYSVKLASKESQTLMDGIKLKAAQKGTTEGMLEQWVTKILLKFKISNKLEVDTELTSLRTSLQQRIGSSLGLSSFGGLLATGSSASARRTSVVSSSIGTARRF